MATYMITAPDGSKFKITADSPEAYQEALDHLKANYKPQETNSNRAVTPEGYGVEPGAAGPMNMMDAPYSQPNEAAQSDNIFSVLFGGKEASRGLADNMQQMEQGYRQHEKDKAANQQFINNSLEGGRALVQGAGDTLSFGLAPLADRALGTATRTLMDGMDGSIDKSVGQQWRDVTDERKQLAEDHPWANMIGETAGAVAGLGTMATQVPAVAKHLGTVGGRLATMAGLGAAENTAVNAGQGDFNMLDPLIGAAGGFGGQLLGEAASLGGRFIRSRATVAGADEAAKDGLARDLLDPKRGVLGRTLNNDQPMDAATLQTLADGMQPGEMLGEQSQGLLDALGHSAGTDAALGKTAKPARIAEQRLKDLPGQTRDIVEETLSPGGTRRTTKTRKALQNMRMEDARHYFSEIFDTPEGRKMPVATKEEIAGQVWNIRDTNGNRVFDQRNVSPSSKAVLAEYQKLVENTGALTTEAGEPALSLKGLQNVKIALDDRIAANWGVDPTSGQKFNTRELAALKNHVNKLISEIEPQYADVSRLYADVASTNKAYDFGSKMVRGTETSQPVEEVAEYMTSLSTPEKRAAQEGALTWVLENAENSGTFLRKLSAENPAQARRLEAIFGDVLQENGVTLADLAEAVDETAKRVGGYKKLVKANETAPSRAATSTPADSNNAAGKIVDAVFATMGIMPKRGMPVSAIRRLVAGDPDAHDRVLFDLLTTDTQEEASKKIADYVARTKRPNAGIKGGAIGAGLTTTLMDE